MNYDKLRTFLSLINFFFSGVIFFLLVNKIFKRGSGRLGGGGCRNRDSVVVSLSLPTPIPQKAFSIKRAFKIEVSRGKRLTRQTVFGNRNKRKEKGGNREEEKKKVKEEKKEDLGGLVWHETNPGNLVQLVQKLDKHSHTVFDLIYYSLHTQEKF